MQDIRTRIKYQLPGIKKRRLQLGILTAALGMLFFSGLATAAYIKKTVETPNNGSSEQVSFSVKNGESLDQVSANLEKSKLVKSDFIFSLYMKASKRSGRIQAGEYQIAGNLNMKDVAGIITAGQVISTRVTIPEGWTLEKMSDRVAAQKISTKEQFLAAVKYTKTRDQGYDFLSGLSEGDSLEGFLYPDTYELSKNADENELITKMLNNFNTKFTNDLREKVKTSGMNTFEVVTLASMVESEAVTKEDRKLVAGVFEKRLDLGMPLQSDVTVLYALKTNKKDVNYKDIQVDSPYNTYKVAGLPAGPICSPSIEAIDAVLNPTKSNYLYFLAAPDGKVYYAATIEQHNQYKAKYLN